MPHGRIREQATATATTRLRSAPTPDSQISTPPSGGETLVAATRPPMVPFRLERSSPINGEFLTCTATPGSGSRIAGHRIHRRSPPMDPHSRSQEVVNSALFEAAVGPRGLQGRGRQVDGRWWRRRTFNTAAFALLCRLANERSIVGLEEKFGPRRSRA